MEGEALYLLVNLLLTHPKAMMCAIAIAFSVVFANFITMLTPSKVDDKFMNAILRALNVIAMNILKNKNKDD